jgi:hypothetical protein
MVIELLQVEVPLTNRVNKEVEMYTRNVRIKLKADSVPEFTRLLEKEIIPLLRQQKGFQDEICFVAPERDEAVAISFWDNRETAEAYNHVAYLDVLRVLSKVAAGMPIMDTFEVGTSTFHRMTSPRTLIDKEGYVL